MQIDDILNHLHQGTNALVPDSWAQGRTLFGGLTGGEEMRPDGADLIFGGSGTAAGRNDAGDESIDGPFGRKQAVVFEAVPRDRQLEVTEVDLTKLFGEPKDIVGVLHPPGPVLCHPTGAVIAPSKATRGQVAQSADR